jgi:hypothetical protein
MLNMNKDYIVQFSQTNKNSGINGLKTIIEDNNKFQGR